jgi:predicted amidohydrolase
MNNYRVTSLCFEPDRSQAIPERLKAAVTSTEKALIDQKPDLLVLPEVAIVTGIDEDQNSGAESIEGSTVKEFKKLAIKHSTNICIPIIENDNGKRYNTAVYLDRKGEIAGIYRKIVPTDGETEKGILPGKMEQAPVILDGIRIGSAICFDENFPDIIWHWIAEGVDLLVFPSYTYAGELMRSWAYNCGVPLIASFPWESVIYDRDGTTLAKGGTETSTMNLGFHNLWITSSINLNKRIYHLDKNQLKLKDISAKYGSQIDIKLLQKDGRFMLTGVSDKLTVDEVEKEFGLVPLQDYLRDSRAMSEKLAGEKG